MHRFHSLLCVLAASLLTTACGSIDTTDSPDEPDLEVDGGSEDDGTVPSVLSVSPANDAIGVGEDEVIVVVFDEPMDQPSVEAAWASADLPADAVSFEWSSTGDTLTVTPNELLPLAQGRDADPSTVDALRFEFTIEASATDLEGDTLAEPTTSSFTTQRRFQTDLTPIAELTRTRRGDGVVFASSAVSLTVGDTNGNLQTKIFASFELPDLPAGAVVESATLRGNQSSTNNTPYVLGSLDAFHINATVIDAGASANELAAIGEFSNSATTGNRSLDVTAFVVDDLANRAARNETTQFRLEFPTPTNSNGVTDDARYNRSGLGLLVSFLLD